MKPSEQLCPDPGMWRSWLDHEGAESWSGLQQHRAHCPRCQRTIDDIQDNAEYAGSAFARLEQGPALSPLDVRRAMARLQGVSTPRSHSFTELPNAPTRFEQHKERTDMKRLTSMSNMRAWLAAAAALLISATVALTPQGQSAAAGFLAQFRSTKLQPVPVSSTSLSSINKTMASFEKLGTVSSPSGARLPDMKSLRVASVAEANQKLPFTVKTPDPKLLPAGVSATPQVTVAPAAEYRFKFDAARANAYFASIGRPDLTLPAHLSGTTLVVSTPAAVLLEYGLSHSAAETPTAGGRSATSSGALVVGEAGELTLGTEGGATLDQVRSFLLTLPNIPPEAAAILNNTDWSSSLPVPIPVDRVQWTSTTIAGQPGLLLNDNTGLGSAAIWHTGPQGSGQIYGVAGTLKATDLAGIASSLR